MLVTELPGIKDRRLVYADPGLSVAAAGRRMTDAGIGCLPVIDTTGVLIGIITERDILTKVVATDRMPHETPVSAVMTPDPKIVRYDSDVGTAAEIMREGNFRHLPILNADDKVIGVISIRDVASFSLAEATALSVKVNVARAGRFRQALFVLGGVLLYTAIVLVFVFYGEALGLR